MNTRTSLQNTLSNLESLSTKELENCTETVELVDGSNVTVQELYANYTELDFDTVEEATEYFYSILPQDAVGRPYYDDRGPSYNSPCLSL